MGRALIAGIILVALVVALPAVGFLTARNSTPVLCSAAADPMQGGDPVAMAHNAAGGDRAVTDQADNATTEDAAARGAARLPTELTVPGSVDGTTLRLSGEQVTIAAAIVAEGKSYGIPQQGWVVALATALQESGIHNLDSGDRDSRGAFQQRPSSGWGTIAQVTDINLSIRAFYGVATHTANPGLVDVPGWEAMPVTRAAQAVQVSAFPYAYARWETTARGIVRQLGGIETTTGVDGACVDPAGPNGHCPATGLAAENGLTPDALLVIRCGREHFPAITSIGGVRADALPDHPSGRAIDLMIPNYQTAPGKAFGWQVAQWMRTNHRALGVQYVIFDAKIWNIARDDEGWRPYVSATASMDDTSLHHDHVHVTVVGAAGIGPVAQGGTPDM